MKSWKRFQKSIRDKLTDFNAKDISYDTSKSPDILLPEFPGLKIDCKYSKVWRHHRLMRETKDKYCEEDDIPILITKQANEQGELVVLPLTYFIFLLNNIKELK